MPDAPAAPPDTGALALRETGLPRRGRRRSNAEDVNSTMAAANALFRRLDAVNTGFIHEEQVQWLWPTLTQHLDAAQNFSAQRQQGGTQVSLLEWQSLMSAVCSVVGSRRLKSSLRRADVIVSKGQMTSRAFTPLRSSSMTLPLYANFCDLKPATATSAAPTSPSHSPVRNEQGYYHQTKKNSTGTRASSSGNDSDPKEVRDVQNTTQVVTAAACAAAASPPLSPANHEPEQPIAAADADEPVSPSAKVDTAAEVCQANQELEQPVAVADADAPVSPSAKVEVVAAPDANQEPEQPIVAAADANLPASPSKKADATAMADANQKPEQPTSPTSDAPVSPSAKVDVVEVPEANQESNQPIIAAADAPISPSAKVDVVAVPAANQQPEQPVPIVSADAPESPSAKVEVVEPEAQPEQPVAAAHAKAPASPSANVVEVGNQEPQQPIAAAASVSPKDVVAVVDQHPEQPTIADAPASPKVDVATAEAPVVSDRVASPTAVITVVVPDMPEAPREQEEASAEEPSSETSIVAAGDQRKDVRIVESNNIKVITAQEPSPREEDQLQAATSSVSSVLSTLPPPEAQEAEAFQRRFQQLRQKSPLPKMAKKKGGKVYQTGLTDPLESHADGGRTHEVMGVNTHVMTTAASEERPSSTPRNEQRDRTPSWIHDGPALHFDDQVPIEDPVELPDAGAHADAEARNDSAAERSGSTAVVAVPDSRGKREREEEPSGKTGSRKAKANAERSAVQLPPISRAATAPGNLGDETEDLQSILESSNVKALKDRLRSEMTLHQQTRNHAKDLEKRLQQATRPPKSTSRPRFGITNTAPYAQKPREKRSVALPPLKPLKSQTSQSSRSPKRSADGALQSVHEMLKDENLSSMSRGGQSRTRLQAYGRLTRAGLSTWDVRLDEKISRFQDMRAFSDSMWTSFHDWNTQYHSVG